MKLSLHAMLCYEIQAIVLGKFYVGWWLLDLIKKSSVQKFLFFHFLLPDPNEKSDTSKPKSRSGKFSSMQ